MPRREPKPAPDFAVDFLADWRTVVHVDNPPAIALGWTLHGTVRKHGKTYALAWQDGLITTCDERGNVGSLTALEQSRVTAARLFDKLPGWESVPKSEPPPGPFMFTWE